MAKTKSYQVQARLNLFVSIDINAASLQEAIEQSKLLKETDFVDFNGDFIDGEMRVTGLCETDPS